MSDSRRERVGHRLFGEAGSILDDGVMSVVAVAALVGVSGTFLVSPVLADLGGAIGASDAQVGLVMTAFTAPSILLTPFFGLLADRVGQKPILVGGLFVLGAAGTAIGFATSFESIIALRVIQGIGVAPVMLASVTLLGDHYRGTDEVTAQGMRFVSLQVGVLGLPLVAGALVLVSWRAPFALFVGGIIAAGWTWRALPATRSTVDEPVRAYVRNLLQLFSRPVMALLILSFAVRFLLTFGFIAYISVLMREMTDASTLFSGVGLALFGLVSLVSGSQIGRLTSGRQPLVLLIGGFVLAGLGLALVGISGQLPVAFLGIGVFAAGGGVTSPLQKSLVNEVAPDQLRGGAVSASMLFQHVGQTFGPVALGGLLTVMTVGRAFVALGLGVGTLGAVICALAYVLDRN